MIEGAADATAVERLRCALAVMGPFDFERAARLAGLDVQSHRQWAAQLLKLQLRGDPVFDNPALRLACLDALELAQDRDDLPEEIERIRKAGAFPMNLFATVLRIILAVERHGVVKATDADAPNWRDLILPPAAPIEIEEDPELPDDAITEPIRLRLVPPPSDLRFGELP